MLRFVDLPSQKQQEIFRKVMELRKNGLGYKRTIKRVREEENVNLCLSTLSYWFNKGVEMLGGENWFEEKPSRDLSYLIGVMFGDGSLSFNEKKQDYSVRLVAIDKDFVEKFSQCLAKVLKRKKNYAINWGARDNIYETKARSKQLYNFFKELRADFSKAKPFIEEYPAEFIQGLADSEGCPMISANKDFSCRIGVAYSTKEELLEYVKELLDRVFSIRARLYLHKKAGITDSVINGRAITRKKIVYGLNINRREGARKFHSRIGFSIRRKKEKLGDGLEILELFGSYGGAREWKKLYSKKGRKWSKVKWQKTNRSSSIA